MEPTEREMWRWFGVFGLAVCAAGCGSAAKAARPAQPAVPYAANQTAATAAFVANPSRVFVARWEPQQLAELSAELTKAGSLAVVRYDAHGMQLLKQCRLGGIYSTAPIAPYGGTHRVSDSSAHGVRAARVAGAAVDRSGAAALDYVISGKRHANRERARRLELQGSDCEVATHFVLAAYTGAFERRSATGARTAVTGGSLGIRAEGSGNSERSVTEAGGDLHVCRAGAGPDDPLCAAAIEVELAPIEESILAHVELVSYTIGATQFDGSAWDGDRSAPDPRFAFTTSSGSNVQTGVYEDRASWAGDFDLGIHELWDGLAIQVRATDDDALFDDEIGTASVTEEQLLAGGLVRVPLHRGATRTGELTLRVTIDVRR